MALIEKGIKEIYIWEEGWQPGSNTIAYYPMNSTTTTTDESGNGNTLTNNGFTFGTQGATTTGSTYYMSSSLTTPSTYYFGIRICPSSVKASRIIAPNGYRSLMMGTLTTGFEFSDKSSSYGTYITLTASYSANQWMYVAMTGDATTAYCYAIIDGTTYSTSGTGQTTRTGIIIGNNGSSSWRSNTDAFIGTMSNLIIENKVRPQSDIESYYNETKSLYGL